MVAEIKKFLEEWILKVSNQLSWNHIRDSDFEDFVESRKGER